MFFYWLFKRTYTIHSGAVTAFFHYWCFRVEIKEHLKEVRYSIKQDSHSINCNLLKQCLLPANPLLFQCFPAFLFFLRDFLGFPSFNGDRCESLNYMIKHNKIQGASRTPLLIKGHSLLPSFSAQKFLRVESSLVWWRSYEVVVSVRLFSCPGQLKS